MAAACSKKFPIKRTALWYMKNKIKLYDRRLFFFFFKDHQKHRSFSWPYVEPPSKSTAASNGLSLDDDAIDIKTSVLFNNKKIDLTKVLKAD